MYAGGSSADVLLAAAVSSADMLLAAAVSPANVLLAATVSPLGASPRLGLSLAGRLREAFGESKKRFIAGSRAELASDAEKYV